MGSISPEAARFMSKGMPTYSGLKGSKALTLAQYKNVLGLNEAIKKGEVYQDSKGQLMSIAPAEAAKVTKVTPAEVKGLELKPKWIKIEPRGQLSIMATGKRTMTTAEINAGIEAEPTKGKEIYQRMTPEGQFWARAGTLTYGGRQSEFLGKSIASGAMSEEAMKPVYRFIEDQETMAKRDYKWAKESPLTYTTYGLTSVSIETALNAPTAQPAMFFIGGTAIGKVVGITKYGIGARAGRVLGSKYAQTAMGVPGIIAGLDIGKDVVQGQHGMALGKGAMWAASSGGLYKGVKEKGRITMANRMDDTSSNTIATLKKMDKGIEIIDDTGSIEAKIKEAMKKMNAKEKSGIKFIRSSEGVTRIYIPKGTYKVAMRSTVYGPAGTKAKIKTTGFMLADEPKVGGMKRYAMVGEAKINANDKLSKMFVGGAGRKVAEIEIPRITRKAEMTRNPEYMQWFELPEGSFEYDGKTLHIYDPNIERRTAGVKFKTTETGELDLTRPMVMLKNKPINTGTRNVLGKEIQLEPQERMEFYKAAAIGVDTETGQTRYGLAGARQKQASGIAKETYLRFFNEPEGIAYSRGSGDLRAAEVDEKTGKMIGDKLKGPKNQDVTVWFDLNKGKRTGFITPKKGKVPTKTIRGNNIFLEMQDAKLDQEIKGVAQAQQQAVINMISGDTSKLEGKTEGMKWFQGRKGVVLTGLTQGARAAGIVSEGKQRMDLVGNKLVSTQIEGQKVVTRYKELTQEQAKETAKVLRMAETQAQEQEQGQMSLQASLTKQTSLQKQIQEQKEEQLQEQTYVTGPMTTPTSAAIGPPGILGPAGIYTGWKSKKGKGKEGRKERSVRIHSIDDPLYRLTGKSKYSDIMNIMRKNKQGNFYV